MKQQDGFISATTLHSPETGWGLDLSTWKDADSIHKWQTEPTHLRFQRTARETVYADYRIRIGPEVPITAPPATEQSEHSEEKQVLVLYQHKTPEGSHEKSKAALLRRLVGDEVFAEVYGDLNDASVFQTETDTVWLSSWKSHGAANEFAASIQRIDGDEVHQILVARAYTKVRRQDAPEDASQPYEP